MGTQNPNQPLVKALWFNMRKTAIVVIILMVSICFNSKATTQQPELNSAAVSTSNKDPVPTSASPTTQTATLFSNTGTSATFSAYIPTITVSVGLSNQQYVSSSYMGVTIGSNVDNSTKISLLADFLYHPVYYLLQTFGLG